MGLFSDVCCVARLVPYSFITLPEAGGSNDYPIEVRRPAKNAGLASNVLTTRLRVVAPATYDPVRTQPD